jgi:mannose-6-phosphate isomerase-like protein (cupin superfamily)
MAYVKNLQEETKQGENFRKVLYTAKNSQLVIMNLKPNEDIGSEVHHLDQFLYILEGQGKAVLNDVESELSSGYCVVVPAGTKHNIINTSSESELKLFTVYSPPDHKDGIIHVTKQDALSNDIEFDGKTTE